MAYFAASSYSLIRYFLQGTVGTASGEAPIQFLEVRLGMISGVQETPIANVVFPLSLSRRPSSFHRYVVQILASLDLHASACDAIARKIAAFVAQLAAGNSEVDLHVVAVVDYIHMEETMILESTSTAAPLGEEEELGDCCICLDQLDSHGGTGSGKKVIRIRCGHVYHEPCILAWLTNKNSCPLCRSPLLFQQSN